MGTEQFIRGMRAYFTVERAEVRKILADASREKHEGIQGQWQQESPFRRGLGTSQEKCGCRLWTSNDAARLPCNEEWQLGRLQRKIRERRKVVGVDPRKNSRCLREGRNSEEGHGLLAAGHCASRWNGRSRLVVCLPTLQQFSFGGPHLVGIDGTRRRQQQKEEALQLVVCGVWRPRRRESAQQNTGGAVRYQCPRGATKAM